MILPGTLLQPTGETPEAPQSFLDSETHLKASAGGHSTFVAVLHDVPDEDPDDGLSTPDITQPLGMVLAQSMPVEAQQLPAESAGDRSGGSPPGSTGRAASEGNTLHSSGVAWPLGDSAASASTTASSSSTPSDSMPQTAPQPVRPGIGMESIQPVALPVSLEVERVELSLQVERTSGSDARAALAARGERIAPSAQGQPGIIRSMTTLAMQQGGAMRIRLDPPALGELIVQMSVTRGHVSMSITATSVAGAEALAGELNALRAGLEQRGFIVERMTVNGPRGMQESMAESDAGEQPARDDAEDATRERRHGRRERSAPQTASMDAVLESVLELEQGVRS
jgi:flagellar hook-length control protein FliK